MNILVQGAGALGAYFGGRMLEAGLNVSFFVREKRAAQLTKEGLKINSPEGNYESKDVPVFTSPEEVENIDLVILAVKGYHLDQAIHASSNDCSTDRSVCTTFVKWCGAFGNTSTSHWKGKSARGICFYYCYVE